MPLHQDFESFVQSIADADDSDDRPVFAINLDDIQNKVVQWNRTFPRVRPFYAMKCNFAPPVVRFIANSGVGFDCASIKELKAAKSAGVGPDRIVFANPCKTRSMLRFARQSNVQLMTFDSEEELKKVAEEFPDAKLLLRLKVDDSLSKYKLGDKFGAKTSEVESLLSNSRDLGLRVVGIAFHVGSDCSSAAVFESAIRMAYESSLVMKRFGFEMEVLDIGGGYPDIIDFENKDDLFFQMARYINKALDDFFPEDKFPQLKIISEPGRYFVGSALVLITKIIGKKIVETEDGKSCMYYLNDGLFGGYLIKFWEPDMMRFRPLVPEKTLNSRRSLKSTFWGPTCDSTDFTVKDKDMKELHVGEFLVTEDYGAYTVPLTTPFNGMEKPEFRTFSMSHMNGESSRR